MPVDIRQLLTCDGRLKSIKNEILIEG